ncbi:hypothetical protein NDU88_000594, partial [Pleurodeles waltl]
REGVLGLWWQGRRICPRRSCARCGERWRGRGWRSGVGRRGVEVESVVQVGRSGVVECLVSVGEELEGDPLVWGEPVEVFQVVGDVAAAGYVEDQS